MGRPKFTPAVRRKNSAIPSGVAASAPTQAGATPHQKSQHSTNPDEAINFFNRIGELYQAVVDDDDDGKCGAGKKRKSEDEGDEDEGEEDMDAVRQNLKEIRKMRRLNKPQIKQRASPSSPASLEVVDSKSMVLEPMPSPSPPGVTSYSSSFTGHNTTSSRSTSSYSLLSPPSTANPRSPKTCRTPSSSRSQPADVINLDSDSDSELQITHSLSSSSLNSTTATAPTTAVPEEEDYFTRLTREARESRTSATPLPTGPTNHLGPSSTPTTLPEDPSTSPVIPIFVTTPLTIPYAYRHIDPDMKVQRRYLQNLVPVKNQYCLLLGLNPERTFFIFNGQRVFERSSLRSLGVVVKEKQCNREEGGWLVTDQRGVEWREEVDEWCVVFELVNREVVEKREAERRRKEAEREEGMGGDEEDDEEGSEGDEKGRIRITMKAKGCKDVVVMVTKETEIATLLETFRNTQKIPDDKGVAIRFEGDEMDPQGTIEDMDIDEDDAEEGVCVDVYVK